MKPALILQLRPGCVSDPPEDKSPDEARAEAAILSLMPEVLARDVPFLGCCYGMGILAQELGGKVSKERFGEPVGPVTCEITDEGARDPLLKGLPRAFDAFVGHKEAAQAVPEADAEVFADRIRIYRNRGYFDPADADALTATCRAADVTIPVEILRRFAARYM